MFFRDLLLIGLKNTKANLKRSLMLIMTLGIIFSLIFTMNLFLQGIADSYANLSGSSANEKVIIRATNNTENEIRADNKPKDQISLSEMIKDIEKYGGRVIDGARTVGAFNASVISKNMVEKSIEVNIDNAPEDAMPVLISTFLGEQLLHSHFSASETPDKNMSTYREYRDSLIGKTFVDAYGAKYYVVGLAPGNFHISNLSFWQLKKKMIK